MITEEEKKFIIYWEKNRVRQKKFFYKLLIGLPAGLIFGLPILITLIFNDWYKNMQFISGSQVIVVIIAVICIIVFYALFRMKYLWESKEQLYIELLHKNEGHPKI